MRILGVAVPVLTADIDSAIARYEALTRERVQTRFIIPERGLTIALLGTVRWPSSRRSPLRQVASAVMRRGAPAPQAVAQ